MQHIKRRVETERIRTGQDKALHLKLGPGGMVDIEFTVQLLQLTWGWDHPSVRHPTTLLALAALEEAGLVQPSDAAALRDCYRFCDRARNGLHLRSGAKGDLLPTRPRARRDIDRLMGLDDVVATYRALAQPARAVVERLFYGG